MKKSLLEVNIDFLCDFGAKFAPFWRHFGRPGRLWGHLGASWARLGASWRPLGASLAHLGVFLAHLGASWASLGASWARLGASSICWTDLFSTNSKCVRWSGGILVPPGHVAAAFWGVFGPSCCLVSCVPLMAENEVSLRT